MVVIVETQQPTTLQTPASMYFSPVRMVFALSERATGARVLPIVQNRCFLCHSSRVDFIAYHWL